MLCVCNAILPGYVQILWYCGITIVNIHTLPVKSFRTPTHSRFSIYSLVPCHNTTDWLKRIKKERAFEQGSPVNWNAFQVTTSWSWLRECQECAKLSSRKRVANWRISNIKYILICLTLFLVTTWFRVCYFIVLMSSLLLYNVENSKKLRETFEWVGVLKLLTGSVFVPFPL